MITLDISYCDRQENPNDFGPWKVVSFNRRHVDFVHPIKVGVGEIDCSKAVSRRLDIGTAWVLGCYSHGNSLWARKDDPRLPKCQFDTNHRAGLLTWERKHGHKLPKSVDARRASADEFLRMYSAWCNGEVHEARLEVDDECEDSMTWYGMDAGQLQYAEKWVLCALKGRKLSKLTGECKFLLEDRLPATLFAQEEI